MLEQREPEQRDLAAATLTVAVIWILVLLSLLLGGIPS